MIENRSQQLQLQHTTNGTKSHDIDEDPTWNGTTRRHLHIIYPRVDNYASRLLWTHVHPKQEISMEIGQGMESRHSGKPPEPGIRTEISARSQLLSSANELPDYLLHLYSKTKSIGTSPSQMPTTHRDCLVQKPRHSVKRRAWQRRKDVKNPLVNLLNTLCQQLYCISSDERITQIV